MASFGAIGGERRRRVLNDQVIQGSSPDAEATEGPANGQGSSATHGKSYDESALQAQPQVTDFVTRRYSLIALAFLTLGSAIAGLEVLYAHLPDWSDVIQPEHAAALDVSAPASLATWLATFLLAAAAGLSWVIHSVRRFKQDDFQGRYRIWLWAAGCWGLMSINATAGLHLVLMDVLSHATGLTVRGDGTLWWLGPAALIVTALLIRLALDMRRCRMAVFLVAMVGVAWAVAIAEYVGWLTFPADQLGHVVRSSLVLGSYVVLLTALMLYARFVVLDAGGDIAPPKPKPKRIKPERPAKKSRKARAEKQQTQPAKQAEAIAGDASKRKSRQLKIDPPHEPAVGAPKRTDLDDEPRPLTRKERKQQRQAAKTAESQDHAAADDPHDDDSEQSGNKRKLSRAERKRLRKQRAREQQAH